MDFSLNSEITYMARTNYRDSKHVFGIKRKDRRQHMYVIGKSGVGKSGLLSNMILQDVLRGEGLCVVDPHGELVEDVLEVVPKHRMHEVIYFNPADPDFHIGFNVLEVSGGQQKHLVASGLMGIFTKIWANVWSSRMEYILNNSILALLDTPGSTLLGIPRLLVDSTYRKYVVSNITDPVVKSFWVNEYEAWQDKFRNEAIAPIQNKVGQFLSSSIVRNIVGQPKSTIDIFELMNEGKILLVNVSKGRIGEDNSALIGAMLVTKLQLAAMERVSIPENERRDFYLYVDEFQNFVTNSFASILSEARKYRLCLIMAHQYVAQLETDTSTVVRDAVFGNVGSMVSFRISAGDAEFLETEFSPEFTPEDFVILPNYKIYLKLMVEGFTSRPFSADTLMPATKELKDPNTGRMVEESSRKLYMTPRKKVEKIIKLWSASPFGQVDESQLKGLGPETAEALESPSRGARVVTDSDKVIAAGNPGIDSRVGLAGLKQQIQESGDNLKKYPPEELEILRSLGLAFAKEGEKAEKDLRRLYAPQRPRKLDWTTQNRKLQRLDSTKAPSKYPAVKRVEKSESSYSNDNLPGLKTKKPREVKKNVSTEKLS